MLISHAHFPILSLPDTSSSPRSRCFFISCFFVITLNLTTITLRPVKRENQLNSHFLLHRLPFYVSFFSACCLFVSSLAGAVSGIASLSFSMCVLFISACLSSDSTTANIRSGSSTLSHSPHSTKSSENKKDERRKKRVTSQGYKTTIVVRSLTALCSLIGSIKSKTKMCLNFIKWLGEIPNKILYSLSIFAGKQNRINAILLP